MKEERKRQKQLEANFEEEYFEDHGGNESTTDSCSCVPVPVCKDNRGDVRPVLWARMYSFFQLRLCDCVPLKLRGAAGCR